MNLFVVLWIIGVAGSALVASLKNRSVLEGLVLGFLFGVLGVVIEALMPGKPSTGEVLTTRRPRSQDMMLGDSPSMGREPFVPDEPYGNPQTRPEDDEAARYLSE